MPAEWDYDTTELVVWKLDEYGIEIDSIGYGPDEGVDPEWDRLCAAFDESVQAISRYARAQALRHDIEPEGGW